MVIGKNPSTNTWGNVVGGKYCSPFDKEYQTVEKSRLPESSLRGSRETALILSFSKAPRLTQRAMDPGVLDVIPKDQEFWLGNRTRGTGNIQSLSHDLLPLPRGGEGWKDGYSILTEEVSRGSQSLCGESFSTIRERRRCRPKASSRQDRDEQILELDVAIAAKDNQPRLNLVCHLNSSENLFIVDIVTLNMTAIPFPL